MSTKTLVHSHSYQHFADLQLSSKEFYKSITDKLQEYQYADVTHRTRAISQFGLFSAKREYLCIYRNDLEYMVCAAPFGRSFLISWWLKEHSEPGDAFLKKLPLLGRFFNREPTFFEVDTALIFSKSIDVIVKTVVEKIKTEQGLRQPTHVLVN